LSFDTALRAQWGQEGPQDLTGLVLEGSDLGQASESLDQVLEGQDLGQASESLDQALEGQDLCAMS